MLAVRKLQTYEDDGEAAKAVYRTSNFGRLLLLASERASTARKIREIMADPRKAAFIGDTFDDQGRSKTLVQLNEGLENAQKLVTKLDRVSAEMREASDRYKKLRTRYFKNPKDKELLDEYVKAEDAVSGLISSYLEVLDDAGSE